MFGTPEDKSSATVTDDANSTTVPAAQAIDWQLSGCLSHKAQSAAMHIISRERDAPYRPRRGVGGVSGWKKTIIQSSISGK